MCSPRPSLLLLDATSPARVLLPKRRRSSETTGIGRTYNTKAASNMALAESTLTSATEQRLPSRRPIDRRWDRSRGILFSKNQQNAIRDFRWSWEDPIVFAEAPASRREYAQMDPRRNFLGRRGRPSQDEAQPDLVDNPHKLSQLTLDPDEVLRQEKQKMRNAHKEELKKKDELIQDLQNMEEKLAQRTQDLESKLAEPHEKLKEREAAFNARVVGKEADLKTRETDLRAREAESQKREDILKWSEANFNSMLEEAKLDAKRNAKLEANEEVEKVMKSALQKNSDATAELDEAAKLRRVRIETRRMTLDDRTKQAQEHETAMIRWHDESSEQLRRAKNDLDKSMESAVEREKRLMGAALRRREEERQDYPSYHQIWDELRRLLAEYQSLIRSGYSPLISKSKAWKEVSQTFDGKRIHRSFPRKYPVLNDQLTQYFESAFQEAESAVQNFRTMNVGLGEGKSVLWTPSHVSRQLSRFHIFHEMHSRFDVSMLENLVFYIVPIRQFRGMLEDQEFRIKSELKAVSIESQRKLLMEKLMKGKNIRMQLGRNLEWLYPLRRRESLKALKADSMFEKKLKLDTESAEVWLDKAASADDELQQYMVQDQSAKGGVRAQERRRRYGNYVAPEQRRARKGLDEYQQLVRKLWLLKTHLGEVDKDDGRYDAAIDKEVAELEEIISRQFDRAVGFTRAAPVRQSRPISGTRQLSLLRPATSTKATLRAPVASGAEMRTREIQELGSRLAEMKQKLAQANMYPSEAAKHKDKQEFRELGLSYKRAALVDLKEKRESAKRAPPADATKVTEWEKQIDILERAVAKASSKAQSKPAASVAKPQQTRGRTFRERKSMRVAKASAAASSAEDNTSNVSAPDEKGEEPAGGGLNFRKTDKRPGPRCLWPDYSRYFHAEPGMSEPASHISHAAPSSRGENDLFGDAMLLPQPLQPTSPPSSRASESDLYVLSQRSDGSDTMESSVSAFTNDLDETYQPSRSFATPLSDLDSLESSYPASSSDNSVSPTSSMELEDAAENLPESEASNLAESDTHLTYEIPAEDYRKAVLASQSTNAAFWSYKLYKNAEGKSPSLHYCTNFETSEAQASQFLNDPVLGFDLEWEYGATPEKSSIKDAVSLIQIASENRIALFQVSLFKGDMAEQLMPPSLRAVLESRSVAKVGVNVSGDALRLQKCFGVTMTGLFELSHLYKVVTYSETEPESVNKRLLKLADQVQTILLLPLKKDQVRTSAWSKRLRIEQTEYAGSDAYAGFRLYHALEARRRKMDPTPPRPAFWEEHKPLVLGDGKVVVRRSAPKRKIAQVDGAAAVEEEDDECEEYFDAVESLDTHEGDSSLTGGVPLAGLTISYPTLPTPEASDKLENQQLQQTSQAGDSKPSTSEPAAPRKSTTSTTAKRNPPPSSPEVIAADIWATTFRSSLPPEYNLKVGHATLRAYHLWHEQQFSCQEVAKVLREPPLSVHTVASYVMQALNEERDMLDGHVEKERVKAVMELLPKSVWGRYWRVLDRIEKK